MKKLFFCLIISMLSLAFSGCKAPERELYEPVNPTETTLETEPQKTERQPAKTAVPMEVPPIILSEFTLENSVLPKNKSDVFIYYFHYDPGFLNRTLYLINGEGLVKKYKDESKNTIYDFAFCNEKFKENLPSYQFVPLTTQQLCKLNELDDCTFAGKKDENRYFQPPEYSEYAYASNLHGFGEDFVFTTLGVYEGAGYFERQSPYTQDIKDYVNEAVRLIDNFYDE